MDLTLKATQILIIAPTQELVNQIAVEVNALSRHLVPQGLVVLSAIKGVYDMLYPDNMASLDAKQQQELTLSQQLASYAHIVVGTPGSVLKFVNSHKLSLSQLRCLILDEADLLMKEDMKSSAPAPARGRGAAAPNAEGLAGQTIKIESRAPHNCQRMLFSATFPRQVQNLAERFAPQAKKFLLVSRVQSKIDSISQFFIRLDTANQPRDQQDRKAALMNQYKVLIQLYSTMELANCIIFVDRKEDVTFLHGLFSQEGYETVVLHGDLDPQERMAQVARFASGKTKVLLCTNVGARGLDFPQVSLVCNFHMPLERDGQPDVDTFIHRIGRTGRANRVGVRFSSRLFRPLTQSHPFLSGCHFYHR